MESIHSQEERLNKIVIKFKRRNSMPCGGSDKLVSSTEIKQDYKKRMKQRVNRPWYDRG